MRTKLLGIAFNVILLTSLIFWLFTLATPSTEAARLRNALLAEIGEQGDFDWLPEQTPESYKQETQSASKYFKKIHQQLFKDNKQNDTEFDKTLKIAKHLLRVEKSMGVGILADTVTAHESITKLGTGYCADFTQVINAMAHAENIPVREWGMAFDGFGGWGHAFNEIYDSQLNKWVFIDVFNSFYIRSVSSNQLLSALEFRDRLLNNPKDIEVVPIVNRRFGFRDREHVLEYFDRGKNQFYLWWGNNIYSYESHPVVKYTRPLSRHLEQLGAIFVGIHPKIRIIKTNVNESMIDDLLNLKVMLIAFVIVGCFLGLVLFTQVWNLYKFWKKFSLET